MPDSPLSIYVLLLIHCLIFQRNRRGCRNLNTRQASTADKSCLLRPTTFVRKSTTSDLMEFERGNSEDTKLQIMSSHGRRESECEGRLKSESVGKVKSESGGKVKSECGGNRKNSSDSEPAVRRGSKPQGGGDLIRIFGGNYDVSDSDMESEEEGDEGLEEEEKKKDTKLNIFKGGLAKKIVTLTEEKKGGRIGQLFRYKQRCRTSNIHKYYKNPQPANVFLCVGSQTDS